MGSETSSGRGGFAPGETADDLRRGLQLLQVLGPPLAAVHCGTGGLHAVAGPAGSGAVSRVTSGAIREFGAVHRNGRTGLWRGGGGFSVAGLFTDSRVVIVAVSEGSRVCGGDGMGLSVCSAASDGVFAVDADDLEG